LVLKNRGFAIFWWATKPLLYKGLHRQFRPKTAVVKTYPIPQGALMRLDSLCVAGRAERDSNKEMIDVHVAISGKTSAVVKTF
jgi:hypothetical protein